MTDSRVYIRDSSFLDNPSVFAGYYSRMPVWRQRKIDSFRSEKDRKLSLLAGILLTEALLDAEISPLSAEISFNPYGKPYIPLCPVKFSISHSGSKAMVAVSESDIGCDIEEIRDIDTGLAKRFFSPEEYRDIENKSEGYEKILEFYRIWTLKESYVKALGRGLDIPLDSFTVSVRDGIPCGPEGCEFRQFITKDGYCCSVCRILEKLN